MAPGGARGLAGTGGPGTQDRKPRAAARLLAHRRLEGAQRQGGWAQERSQRPPRGPERGRSPPSRRPVTHREAPAGRLRTDLSGASLVLCAEVPGDGEGHQTPEESLQ